MVWSAFTLARQASRLLKHRCLSIHTHTEKHTDIPKDWFWSRGGSGGGRKGLPGGGYKRSVQRAPAD